MGAIISIALALTGALLSVCLHSQVLFPKEIYPEAQTELLTCPGSSTQGPVQES